MNRRILSSPTVNAYRTVCSYSNLYQLQDCMERYLDMVHCDIDPYERYYYKGNIEHKQVILYVAKDTDAWKKDHDKYRFTAKANKDSLGDIFLAQDEPIWSIHIPDSHVDGCILDLKIAYDRGQYILATRINYNAANLMDDHQCIVVDDALLIWQAINNNTETVSCLGIRKCPWAGYINWNDLEHAILTVCKKIIQ